MDVTALVARVRDHYVAQFEAFANQQRRSCTRGASEVKLRLDENSELYQRLYCVDFIKNDGGSEVIELQPDTILTFQKINGCFGAVALSIEHLRWDDVVIYHDLSSLPQDEIDVWFRRWFDPNDERRGHDASLSRVIHSLLIRPGVLSIDFGTAAPEALMDLLALLERARATNIRISSSRAEKPPVL